MKAMSLIQVYSLAKRSGMCMSDGAEVFLFQKYNTLDPHFSQTFDFSLVSGYVNLSHIFLFLKFTYFVYKVVWHKVRKYILL